LLGEIISIYGVLIMALALSLQTDNEIAIRWLRDDDNNCVEIGGNSEGALKVSLLKKVIAYVEKNRGQWEIFTVGGSMSVAGETKKYHSLQVGDRVTFTHYPQLLLRAFEEASGEGLSVALDSRRTYTLGRSDNCDIVLRDPRISSRHAAFSYEEGAWAVRDLGSKNGLYVNGTKRGSARLAPGDVITILDAQLSFDGDSLLLRNDSSAFDTKAWKPSSVGAFRRSNRIMPRLPQGHIKVALPPRAPIWQGAGYIVFLLPCFAAFGAFGFAIYARAMRWPIEYIYYSLALLPASVMIALTIYTRKRHRFQRRVREREETYKRYIESVDREASTAAEEQHSVLSFMYPDAEECVSIAMERGGRLWEREPSDSDFLVLSAGYSPQELSLKVKLTGEADGKDPLHRLAVALKEKFSILEGLAYLIDLRHMTEITLAGTTEATSNLARCLALEAAVLHSPSDLQIMVLYPEGAGAAWEWAASLPHAAERASGLTLTACGQAEASKLLEWLEAEISKNRYEHVHTLLIVCEKSLSESFRIRGGTGLSVIYLESEEGTAVQGAGAYIWVGENQAIAYDLSKGKVPEAFKPAKLSAEDAQRASKAMAEPMKEMMNALSADV